jgi:hypothetical protein
MFQFNGEICNDDFISRRPSEIFNFEVGVDALVDGQTSGPVTTFWG